MQAAGRPRLAALLHAVTVLVIIAYPLAVWLGLRNGGMGVLAPILMVTFILRLLTFRGKLSQLTALGRTLAAAGLLFAAASWLLHESQMLLYYPVVVNTLLLLLFGYSLLSPPPVVERLARLSQPDLPPKAVSYTRRVTQVWCVFFFLNGAIAFYTCLKGDVALWTLYNGGISYLLIGLLMGVEWIVRKRVQRA
ncbi:hypothetical protein [Rouxiella badensis]|jgi:uncharacterized membrane protein|uniref:COG4648 family protein n=1 Tax=Rouxiella badensis TaxID=1646377 RepID=UPI0013EF15A4|nr:hypothetical protein [Rouxiella badensis]MCC3703903.1 hypothetical protein [Rouxiella badensis]MCC3718924.1 hypothetical protein [Rouxiella badensis]MCC3728978.1 hypothetical protein [Rouxiella badensis]MCC3733511.1 hypothetical protein [Rouxiella badensis]MCC3740529.1 hypothetical protein [Rouxiella badensis]